jgi:hypothetical protein
MCPSAAEPGVISAPVVRRAIALSGLDRLVPVFPTREAAQAAPPLAAVLSLPPGWCPAPDQPR